MSKAIDGKISGLILCLSALMLAGCVETARPVVVAAPVPVEENVKIKPVPGANIAAVPLCIVSLDGAPAQAKAALVTELQKQSALRQIVLADAKSAKYLARGYFSVVSQGENTQFIYVWDVADAEKHETHRLTDAVVVKGASANPWALFSADTAADLAEKAWRIWPPSCPICQRPKPKGWCAVRINSPLSPQAWRGRGESEADDKLPKKTVVRGLVPRIHASVCEGRGWPRQARP